MPTWATSSDLWLALGCYGAAVVSAIVPWVNAELLMLSAVPLAGSRGELTTLVLAVTMGQMTGKSVMYWLSRTATGDRARRLHVLTERWRDRFAQHPRSVVALVLVSALVGFPPFYLVSIAAGAFKVAFARFLAVGAFGRLLHFAIIAAVPHLLWEGL
jgi:membrane protein YqaA with SNARE-associated domain